MNIEHDETNCEVCKIIQEEENRVEKIRTVNEQRIKKGLEPLDDGSSIPVHCGWCINNID